MLTMGQALLCSGSADSNSNKETLYTYQLNENKSFYKNLSLANNI